MTVLGSVLVVNLQLRLMDVAGEAQTLGAAMNHASLNVANALGAWLGGPGHRRRLRLPLARAGGRRALGRRLRDRASPPRPPQAAVRHVSPSGVARRLLRRRPGMRLVFGSLRASRSCCRSTDGPAASADPEAPAGSRARGTAHAAGSSTRSGRALVLHGVNMVYKRPPYAPDKIGFGRDDARFLARTGFRTVRLGPDLEGGRAAPGKYDDRYLARIARTAEILAKEGIWTMLDFHQDLYNERFQGEGAPDWAVQDGGLPAEPQLGFPFNYFAMPALNGRSTTSGATPTGPGGVGLQDRYAAAWAHTAAYFRTSRRSSASTCSTSRGRAPADALLHPARLPGVRRQARAVLAAQHRRDPQGRQADRGLLRAQRRCSTTACRPRCAHRGSGSASPSTTTA